MGRRIDISGSCAIVTGAAGGIGLQFARELAKRKCSLMLLDINAEKLEETAEMLTRYFGVTVHHLAIDLTLPDAVERIEAACSEFGIEPDILINNAGIFAFRPVTDIDERKIEAFISLHVAAVTSLSRWFAIRRKPSGSGWILNMSSMSCWMPMPGLAMYAATKAYIRVFSRSLHYEMKDYGVGVTVARPGGISTDLFGLPENLKRLAVNIKVLDTPENFVRNAVDRMLRGKKQYINGWINRLSILFVGMMPTSVRMMVKHRLLDKGIIR